MSANATQLADAAAARCIVCGCERSDLVLRREGTRGTGRTLRLLRCADCSTIFQDGWAGEFEAPLYDYYRARVGRSWSELHDEITRGRIEALLAQLGRLHAGRRLLDVGCGQGFFAYLAQSAGWQAEGIDLSEGAVAVGRPLGAPIRVESVFSELLPAAGYDLVTLFEFIEHVPEPARFVQRVAELVAPGGHVYLTTPNFDCLDRRLMGAEWPVIHEEHLSYFTPRTLSAMIESVATLEILELQTKNLSLAPLSTLTRRLRRPARVSPVAATSSTPKNGNTTARGRDQSLRALLESSRGLQLGKQLINAGLNRTQLGNAMTVLCRRR